MDQMKKKILLCLIGLLISFPYFLSGNSTPQRGLFVSLVQDPPTLTSREAILELIDFSKRARIKILFVQIYRANQAWFPSEVGDTASYEKAREALGEEPFEFLIREAHRAGIQVHAWLNLLSLGENADAPILKKYGTDILTRNPEEKKSLEDYKIDNQYFLEPGDPRIRAELTAMVREVVRNYPSLDGIQLDYIRYPDSRPRYGYTKVNIDRFREATGLMKPEEGSRIWNEWKRAQVTDLLKLLILEIRTVRQDIQISATGCMSYARALDEAFQDWPSWVNGGLVDFVTLMNYSPDPEEYERWNAFARRKVTDPSKLYLGVGAYKLVYSSEIFKEEFRSCEGTGAPFCVVFHYGSLLENHALEKPLLSPE